MGDVFKRILREEMERQRISANSLGKKAGCTGRVISYYLRGEKMPTLENADKILKALGVSMTIGHKR